MVDLSWTLIIPAVAAACFLMWALLSQVGEQPWHKWRSKLLRTLKAPYVAVMLLLGAMIALGALWFYLYDILRAVAAITDRLLYEARSVADSSAPLPEGRAEALRDLATAAAILLTVLAGGTALLFKLAGIWTTERATQAQEQALVHQRNRSVTETFEKTFARDLRDPSSPLAGTEHHGAKQEFLNSLAIQELATLARQDPEYSWVYAETLASFIRYVSPIHTAQKLPFKELDPYSERRLFHLKTTPLDGYFNYMMGGKVRKWAREIPLMRGDVQLALNVLLEILAARPTPIGYVAKSEARIDLTRTNLQQCRLMGADLSSVDLSYSDLSGSIICKSVIGNSTLDCTLRGVAFEEVNFCNNSKRTIFRKSCFDDAVFIGTDFKNFAFDNCSIRGAYIFNADVSDVASYHSDFESTVFSIINFKSCSLSHCVLAGAKILQSNLQDFQIRYALIDDETELRDKAGKLLNLKPVNPGADLHNLIL